MVLAALKERGSGDADIGVEALAGEVENEMAACEIGAEAESGFADEFDEIVERQALDLVEMERRRSRIRRLGDFGWGDFGFNHGGHGMRCAVWRGISDGARGIGKPAADPRAVRQFCFGGK